MYTDYPSSEKVQMSGLIYESVGWGSAVWQGEDVGWGTPKEHFTEEVIMRLNPMQ